MPTETDLKLAETLSTLRMEVTERFGQIDRDLAGFRAGFAEFRGAIKNDLAWIKRIGASVLLIALASSAWMIREITTVKDDLRHHDARIDGVEKRLEGIDAKLDRIEKALAQAK